MDNTTVIAHYSRTNAALRFALLGILAVKVLHQTWPDFSTFLSDTKYASWSFFADVFLSALILSVLARNICLWHHILYQNARAIWIADGRLYYRSYVTYRQKTGIPIPHISEAGTCLSDQLRHCLYRNDHFIQLRLNNDEIIPIEVGWLRETPDDIICDLNMARLRG